MVLLASVRLRGLFPCLRCSLSGLMSVGLPLATCYPSVLIVGLEETETSCPQNSSPYSQVPLGPGHAKPLLHPSHACLDLTLTSAIVEAEFWGPGEVLGFSGVGMGVGCLVLGQERVRSALDCF